MASTKFKRSDFDGWSHEQMVDAYLGQQIYIEEIEQDIADAFDYVDELTERLHRGF